MRIGSLIQKVMYENPTLIDGRTAVRMATIDAAKVLNLQEKIGSLEIDKYADMIIIALSNPHIFPSYDPYSTILYSAEESDVETVIINGKLVMENRQLITVDKEKAIRDVDEWVKKLLTSSSKEAKDNPIEKTFQLCQNFPNPFNPTTTISYSIPELSNVTIKVYDVLGGEVAALVNEEKPEGNYEIDFTGHNLSSGIYFYTLRAGSYIESKKMILIK
jgi:hypothetical protein